MPKNKFGKRFAVLLSLLICTVLIGYAERSPVSTRLQEDHPVSLRFFGSPDAELFTKELDASFQGVLQDNWIATTENGFPAGFVNASLPGFPWAGTMWSRDGGTFMRELVMRGYYQHAATLAAAAITSRYFVHLGIPLRLNRQDKTIRANNVTTMISI